MSELAACELAVSDMGVGEMAISELAFTEVRWTINVGITWGDKFSKSAYFTHLRHLQLNPSGADD